MARTACALMKNKTEFRAAQAAWPRQGYTPRVVSRTVVHDRQGSRENQRWNHRQLRLRSETGKAGPARCV